MRLLLLSAISMIALSCGHTAPNTKWQVVKSIQLDDVNPIGLTMTKEGLWLSDGDRNRLVLIDEQGTAVRTIDSLERPMHIDSDQNTLYIPLYGNDLIAKIAKKAILTLPIKDSLDAPAGISVKGTEKAIADFYNHRILYSKDGDVYLSIGKEGKADGDFYYPTDVQITDDHIWVADAYNNRIQVFDKEGRHLRTLGADQKMNAATGIFVSTEEVFVTDFENDRVLVLDHDGNLKQTITEGVEKPTDILLDDHKLYIINYRSGTLQILERK